MASGIAVAKFRDVSGSLQQGPFAVGDRIATFGRP